MRFTLNQVNGGAHTSSSYKLVTKWILINIGACVTEFEVEFRVISEYAAY